ncbi:MAG TPA: histidine kinase [Candidatus Aquilonibacter sp.]|nr:histidine kinase [Candidatus Aquilonibacter sp.]
MHPILSQFRRLAMYLAAWIPIAALLAYLLAASSRLTRAEAWVLAIHLCLAYAFVCLSAYYECRALPLDKTSDVKLIFSHLAAGLVGTGIWLLAAKVLVIELAQTSPFRGIDKRFSGAVPVLVATGILLYLLSAASYYTFIAVTASHEAEARAIVAQVLARDAELKALKAQVNPHFLFNSLNSISALTSSDPAKAREMCILLGDFLRRTLGLGAKTAIPLEEELSLIHAFIAVEKIRFGSRLEMLETVDPDAQSLMVPPLLLQPLVENAVVHGVANLVNGGWIQLNVKAGGGLLSVVVENEFDPEAPPRHRNGVGLSNVQQRLETRYGKRASMDVAANGERFRVSIAMPAERAEETSSVRALAADGA